MESEPPTCEVVANAFVCQYYHILYQSPELAHRFYQEISVLGRPDESGEMSNITTLKEIDEKILSMHKADFDLKTEIKSIDAHDSLHGGVFVLVTGFMTSRSSSMRQFCQTFFLAPQEKGYFVLNDILRYTECPNEGVVVVSQESTHTEMEAHSCKLSPVEDVSNPEEAQGCEQFTELEEDAKGKKECNPPGNAQEISEEVEDQEPDGSDDVRKDSQDITESTFGLEDTPKKSYASIVKVCAAPPTPASSGFGTASKTQNHQVVAVSAPEPAPVNVSKTPVSSTHVDDNGHYQDTEGEGYSIYIRGLPINATYVLVEDEFKKFGPIKSNGVQVKVHKGFCFGFVEFETPGAAQSALEASPILINGRQVYVEEKRSTFRGNVRGRFSYGRGGGTGLGYRNEGGRGRSNFNTFRNFGRDDFHGRGGDFGNRSRNGSSYRGGDGFARVSDQVGSYGSRSNRAGLISRSPFERSVVPPV